jgi:hypothetical protein
MGIQGLNWWGCHGILVVWDWRGLVGLRGIVCQCLGRRAGLVVRRPVAVCGGRAERGVCRWGLKCSGLPWNWLGQWLHEFALVAARLRQWVKTYRLLNWSRIIGFSLAGMSRVVVVAVSIRGAVFVRVVLRGLVLVRLLAHRVSRWRGKVVHGRRRGTGRRGAVDGRAGVLRLV